MTAPSSARPLYREAVDERRRIALRLVGHRVAVHVDPCRDGDTTRVTGRLLSVASPLAGTVADLAVIRRDEPLVITDVAVSLATVRSIVDLGR